jgi:hypothetical protein
MVREIEKVLGEQIERRRLPGFDYEGFVPESRPQREQSRQPQQAQSHRRRGSRTNRRNHAPRRNTA